MANYVYITLDTTAPANPSINIEGGAIFTTNQIVNLTISVADADTTGYQMLIWGDVDVSYNPNIKTTEATSQWIAYNQTPQVKLSSGDGSKTINLKVRDDVHNPSNVTFKSISLDTSIPTVTVTTPDVSKISKITGKDTATFTFSVNEDITEYKVKLVSAVGAVESTGTTIPTTGGSLNTSGTGTITAGTPTTVTIKGADLATAGATDGQKIIKVFVKDTSGLWSV